MGNSINRQRTDGLTAARYLYDPAGGYFDGRGRACYYIPDYQGNNLGVVDADGHLTQRTDYYPYGEAWRQPEADVNPWLYSDKELLSVDGQHEYDFGPRRYTPGFPMFTTPDQMSEARPWHSPYLFCGANPVMNTDPTGMYFTEGSKPYIDTYRRNILNRLAPDLRNLKHIVDVGVSLYREMRELREMLKELSVLESSETAYNVVIDGSLEKGDFIYGGTSYDKAHNWLNIALYDDRMALFSHEMKHAYQFEMGDISFGIPKPDNSQDKNPDGTKKKYTPGAPYYDQTDEIEAYQRGLLFDGATWESVKDNEPYCFLYDTPFGWNSSMCGTTNDDALQRNANKHRACFKANGKVFLPQEE